MRLRIAARYGREVRRVVQSLTVPFSNLSISQFVYSHLIEVSAHIQYDIAKRSIDDICQFAYLLR
jgi:hypothetical protein